MIGSDYSNTGTGIRWWWSQRVSERSPLIHVCEDPTALAKLLLPPPLPLPLPFYIPLSSLPFLAPPLAILPLDPPICYCSTHHHYHNNNNNPTVSHYYHRHSFLGHKVLHLLTPMPTHKPACKAPALMVALILEISSVAQVP